MATKKKTPPGVKVLVDRINKAAGYEIVVRGSDIHYEELPRITTGVLGVDVALGGGWPANQWSEVIGLESSGKTALVLKTVAANQAADPNFHTVWVAAEEFVESYAEMLGVDCERVTVIDTNVMEDAFEYVNQFLESREVDLIVIDSLPAMVPTSEDDKAMDQMGMADGARVINRWTRKARKHTRRSLVEEERPVTGLVINQWRDTMVQWGDPRTTPGGKGKNYFFFVRVEVKRLEYLGKRGERVGQTIEVLAIKNKLSAPGKTAVVDFYFEDTPTHDAGEFDSIKEIQNLAIRYEVLERRGAWYYFTDPDTGEEEKFSGKEGIALALEERPDFAKKLSEVVLDVARFGWDDDDEPEPEPAPTVKRTTKKR